jgi:pimeloyl-ACP methyl ester carboxylesterase
MLVVKHLLSSFQDLPPVDAIARSIRTADDSNIWFDEYQVDAPSIALIVPGFWRDRSHPALSRLARQVSSLGFRPVVLDIRGHGESSGRYGFNDRESDDVAAVARLVLQERSPAGIVLIGLSVGGGIAVAAAHDHPDLPWSGLLLISAVARFRMIRPMLNPLTMHRHLSAAQALRTPRFTWRFLFSRKRAAADEIGALHQPLCLIHMKNDWLIGHRHALELYRNASGEKELHLVDRPGCFHADRLFHTVPDEVGPAMESFLRRVHRGKAAPGPA